MEPYSVDEICMKSPDGKCWMLKISNRGAVIVEEEVGPTAKDAAQRDYANFQAILEKAWSEGIVTRAIEIAGGAPSQADLDAAKLEFEDYVDTHDSEIVKFKLGKQPVLIAKWADVIDNPFSQNVVDTVSSILNEDPNT